MTEQVATVLASAIGGLFGLGGGGISNAAIRDTNRTNYKIHQEDMANNNMLFDKSIRNQWDMQRFQNDYNSANAQMSRLNDAGINPYMALSNITPGIAQGGTTISSPGTPSPISMQAPTSLGESLGNLANNAVNIFKTLNEAHSIGRDITGKDVDNEVNSRTKDSQIKLINANSDNAYYSAQYKLDEWNFFKDTRERAKTLMDANIAALQEQTNNTIAQTAKENVLTDIQVYYRDNLQPLELTKLNAEIIKIGNEAANAYASAIEHGANARAAEAAAQKYIQESLNAKETRGLIKNEKQMSDALLPYAETIAKNKSDKLGYDTSLSHSKSREEEVVAGAYENVGENLGSFLGVLGMLGGVGSLGNIGKVGKVFGKAGKVFGKAGKVFGKAGKKTSRPKLTSRQRHENAWSNKKTNGSYRPHSGKPKTKSSRPPRRPTHS